MADERRRYIRHPVFWDAEVQGSGFGPWPFEILDFCEGGLFIAPATETTAASVRRSLTAGAAISLVFLDPLSGRRRLLNCRVARITEDGAGIAFQQPQPEVVVALTAVSESRTAADSAALQADLGGDSASGRKRREALNACRTILDDYFQQRLGAFLPAVDTALFEHACESRAVAEQSAYFDALKALRARKDDIRHALLTGVLKQFDALGKYRLPVDSVEAGSEGQLALVEDAVFEEWLSRSTLITKAESRSIRRLRLLQRRLSYLARVVINDAHNPIAPSAVFHVLSEALAGVPLENGPQLKIYETFGRTVMGQLGALYDGLNARLRELGILPHLEDEGYRLRRPGAPSGAEPAEAPAPTAQAKQARAQAEEGSEDRETAPPRTAAALSQAYQRLRRAGQRWLGRGPAEPQGPAYANDEVVAAVDQLRQQPVAAAQGTAGNDTGAPPASLKSRLLSALQAVSPGKELNQVQQEKLDILDRWFGDRQPPPGSEAAHAWIQRLGELALRVELEEGGFLREQPHAIHELLNQADRAGEAIAAASARDREKMQGEFEEVLSSAVRDFDGRPELLLRAGQKLADLAQRPLQNREANTERVRQAADGAERLELAKTAVHEAIEARIAGQRVPRLLLNLLELGWRNQLVLVQLRQGPDSEAWRRDLGVLDRLLAGLGVGGPAERLADAEGLLQRVDAALSPSCAQPGRLKELLEQLRVQLTAAEPPRLELIQVPPAGVIKPEPRADLPQEALGQAKLLGVGDWVVFRDGEGKASPLRIAWINAKRTRYVFVNRQGLKAAELGVEELAEKLSGSTAEVGEELDKALTERRWQDMLVKLNQELAHQASHDSLTEVLNRRALQRRLRELLVRPPRPGETHVLCHIALDGFKVVNNTVGHAGGDRVLRAVARMLKEVAGERGMVGRLGGDEFAVLLPRCDEKAGVAFAEAQCRAIRERAFEAGDDRIHIAASIGVVSFSRESHTLEELLKDSDATCSTAKNAGGHRVHVFKPGDSEMAKLRLSMQQAARVDKALEANLVRLRCQRMIPLTAAGGSKPHYEVLITLGTDTEEVIRPQDFIPAAERFGRMPAVDRWVIRAAFDWCNRNPGRMEAIGGLSINLSGQTLTDIGFLDFLKAEIKTSGVPAEKICFEVTETAAVANLGHAADLIREIKALGCKFSLDDFGSGLSSYSYLKNLPADYLKIDGEFVRDLDREQADYAMIRSINDLCHHLGKLTVAEFVESDQVLEQLRLLGVDFAQGFGIEPPVPIERMGVKQMHKVRA